LREWYYSNIKEVPCLVSDISYIGRLGPLVPTNRWKIDVLSAPKCLKCLLPVKFLYLELIACEVGSTDI
jgi:hypothetical protein